MIEVYKMGRSYYSGGIDKNSGLAEAFMISKKLADIETQKDILVIINGVRDDEDVKYLFERINQADLRIFIMSDSIALKTSLDIINKCDICLHQGYNYNFKEIKCFQFYSYVPELFYENARNEYKTLEVNKKNKILFGGNNLDRQDKFNSYEILSCDLIDAFVKIYDKNGNTISDDRIAYENYIKTLAQYDYSLVICREEYRRSNWLTSRLFESVAVDCLPIVDVDYAIDCDLVFPVRTWDYRSMLYFKTLCDKDKYREEVLKFYREKLNHRSELFVLSIKNYIDNSEFYRRNKNV